MIHGLDTGFLVATELLEHADHHAARQTLASLIGGGDQLGIAAQVLAEFIHVATDSRRLARPLDIVKARQVAERWWNSKDIFRVFPGEISVHQFLGWLEQFSLGRKRLLDTLSAATYHEAGIHSLLTTNASDFSVFGVFTCITPTSPTPHS